MYDSVNTGRRNKRWAGAVGLLAAGAISGGVLASALSASASGNASTAAVSTVSSSAGEARTPGPGGAQPVRPDEKSVPGATAATLRAAARPSARRPQRGIAAQAGLAGTPLFRRAR